MPRRAEIQPRQLEPDAVHGSVLVTQLVNRLMLDGKKSVSEQIVYDALSLAAEKTGKPELEVLEQAVKSVTPVLEVRSRRVGGANYQVPVEVRPVRRMALAMRWLREAAKKRGEKSMPLRLAGELLEAAEGRGGAMKKREEVHRMAEANKAFAHFRF
jgi:small subunit ribosomal protein S7